MISYQGEMCADFATGWRDTIVLDTPRHLVFQRRVEMTESELDHLACMLSVPGMAPTWRVDPAGEDAAPQAPAFGRDLERLLFAAVAFPPDLLEAVLAEFLRRVIVCGYVYRMEGDRFGLTARGALMHQLLSSVKINLIHK